MILADIEGWSPLMPNSSKTVIRSALSFFSPYSQRDSSICQAQNPALSLSSLHTTNFAPEYLRGKRSVSEFHGGSNTRRVSVFPVRLSGSYRNIQVSVELTFTRSSKGFAASRLRRMPRIQIVPTALSYFESSYIMNSHCSCNLPIGVLNNVFHSIACRANNRRWRLCNISEICPCVFWAFLFIETS